MKKTYDVCFRMTSQKATKGLSVMFFFAFFFLGMTSTTSAQRSVNVVTEASSAVVPVDFDRSITLDAVVTLDKSQIDEILGNELKQLDPQAATTLALEGLYGARVTFVESAIKNLADNALSINEALYNAQYEMSLRVATFSNVVRQQIDVDAIARDYVNRLN